MHYFDCKKLIRGRVFKIHDIDEILSAWYVTVISCIKELMMIRKRSLGYIYI